MLADWTSAPLPKALDEILPRRDYEDWSGDAPTAADVEDPGALPTTAPGGAGAPPGEPLWTSDYPDARTNTSASSFARSRQQFQGPSVPTSTTLESQGRVVTKTNIVGKQAVPPGYAEANTEVQPLSGDEVLLPDQLSDLPVEDDTSGNPVDSTSTPAQLAEPRNTREQRNRAGAEALARFREKRRQDSEMQRDVRPRLDETLPSENVDTTEVDAF